MSTELQDMFDIEYKVGDIVARALQSGRSVNLQVNEVTRIENGRIYLDGSKTAIIYPRRLMIVSELFKDKVRIK